MIFHDYILSVKMRLHPHWRMPSQLFFIFLSCSSITFIGGDKSEDRSQFYWASCNNDSKWNVHDKNLMFDNIFENDTLKMDAYKGKVSKESYSKITFKVNID